MISIKNTGSVIEMLLLSIDLDLKCRVQADLLIQVGPHYVNSLPDGIGNAPPWR